MVSTSDGESLAMSMGASYIETSSKRVVNGEEAFNVLVRLLRKANGVDPAERSKDASQFFQKTKCDIQ